MRNENNLLWKTARPAPAIAADLRSQAKQAHWTVVGPNFIALQFCSPGRAFDAAVAAH